MVIAKASTSINRMAHLHGHIAFHLERLVVIGGLPDLLRIHPVVA